MTEPALLVGYDATVDALEAELDRAGPGCEVRLAVYLIEPGWSSRRVLEALRRAVARGARAAVAVDGTVVSGLSRLVERTGTLFPELARVAARSGGRLAATRRRTPDHAKYLLVRRPRGGPHGPSAAVLGGVNLGDRFRAWDDLAVRVEGDAALDALERALATGAGGALATGAGGALAPTGPGAPGPATRFVANAPERGAFGVRPLLEGVLGDPRWTSLRAAFAYVDLAGVELLGRALDRGAGLELVVPGRANVYEHANQRAVARLLARAGAGSQVRVLAAPRMLHAKALVARAADGEGLALLGSANLKRNSLRWLGELVVVSGAATFVEALDRALGRWAAASAPRAGPLRYGRLRAALEDALG